MVLFFVAVSKPHNGACEDSTHYVDANSGPAAAGIKRVDLFGPALGAETRRGWLVWSNLSLEGHQQGNNLLRLTFDHPEVAGLW